MDRRDFIKQSSIISLLPLLPNITMSQVRPTIDITIALRRLSVVSSKAIKAMRDLGMSIDGATESIDEFNETKPT